MIPLLFCAARVTATASAMRSVYKSSDQVTLIPPQVDVEAADVIARTFSAHNAADAASAYDVRNAHG